MQTAIAAIFVFLLVILLHELGHFLVAKLVGIKVNEFSIGMGPKLIQSKKGETLYTFRALPIGGFVRMEGEEEDSNDPRAFNSVSPLSRIAVVAAGAIMNFVLAIVVFSIVSFSLGSPTNIIGRVIPDSPAQYGGVIEGDKFISINNTPISTWDELSEAIASSDSNDELNIGIIRDGEEETLSIKPTITDGRVMLGIEPHYEKSIIAGIKGGFQMTATFLGLMFDFLKMIFTGGVSINDFAGPVGVINEIGNAARMGMLNLLILLGYISINLGVLNLLPIPALDGSKIVFLLIELIRGKPINPEKEGWIHFVGIIFLLGLMLVVTYKDLLKMNIFG